MYARFKQQKTCLYKYRQNTKGIYRTN